MKAEILKIAGVKSEKEFYSKYPTEEAFMKAHKKEFKKAAMGTKMVNKQLTQLTDFGNPPIAQDGYISPVGSYLESGGQEQEVLRNFIDNYVKKQQAAMLEQKANMASQASAEELRGEGEADLHRSAVQHRQRFCVSGQFSGQHQELPGDHRPGRRRAEGVEQHRSQRAVSYRLAEHDDPQSEAMPRTASASGSHFHILR